MSPSFFQMEPKEVVVVSTFWSTFDPNWPKRSLMTCHTGSYSSAVLALKMHRREIWFIVSRCLCIFFNCVSEVAQGCQNLHLNFNAFLFHFDKLQRCWSICNGSVASANVCALMSLPGTKSCQIMSKWRAVPLNLGNFLIHSRYRYIMSLPFSQKSSSMIWNVYTEKSLSKAFGWQRQTKKSPH